MLGFTLLPAAAYCEGDVENLKQYEYWNNGRVRNCTVYDRQGFLKGKAFCRTDGIVEKTEKYDRMGNKVEEAIFDARGKLVAGIDGWAATRWQYDGSRLVAQVTYDEFGRPLEFKQYSQGGNLLARQSMDSENINQYEEAYMAAMLGGNNRKFANHDER